MTRLYLVRHGETLWEPEDRLKGQLDVSLNARGRRQAEAAAGYFRGSAPSAIYSATLARARQTAQPIAVATRCPVLATPLLCERGWGLWQGLTADQVRRERGAGRVGAAHSAPLGEPWDDMARRIGLFLDLVIYGRAGETVIAVTHGGVIKSIVIPVLGVLSMNRPAFTADTGTISLLEHDGHGWRPVFLNAKPAWAREHCPA